MDNFLLGLLISSIASANAAPSSSSAEASVGASYNLYDRKGLTDTSYGSPNFAMGRSMYPTYSAASGASAQIPNTYASAAGRKLDTKASNQVPPTNPRFAGSATPFNNIATNLAAQRGQAAQPAAFAQTQPQQFAGGAAFPQQQPAAQFGFPQSAGQQFQQPNPMMGFPQQPGFGGQGGFPQQGFGGQAGFPQQSFPQQGFGGMQGFPQQGFPQQGGFGGQPQMMGQPSGFNPMMMSPPGGQGGAPGMFPPQGGMPSPQPQGEQQENALTTFGEGGMSSVFEDPWNTQIRKQSANSAAKSQLQSQGAQLAGAGAQGVPGTNSMAPPNSMTAGANPFGSMSPFAVLKNNPMMGGGGNPMAAMSNNPAMSSIMSSPFGNLGGGIPGMGGAGGMPSMGGAGGMPSIPGMGGSAMPGMGGQNPFASMMGNMGGIPSSPMGAMGGQASNQAPTASSPFGNPIPFSGLQQGGGIQQAPYGPYGNGASGYGPFGNGIVASGFPSNGQVPQPPNMRNSDPFGGMNAMGGFPNFGGMGGGSMMGPSQNFGMPPRGMGMDGMFGGGNPNSAFGSFGGDFQNNRPPSPPEAPGMGDNNRNNNQNRNDDDRPRFASTPSTTVATDSTTETKLMAV